MSKSTFTFCHLRLLRTILRGTDFRFSRARSIASACFHAHSSVSDLPASNNQICTAIKFRRYSLGSLGLPSFYIYSRKTFSSQSSALCHRDHVKSINILGIETSCDDTGAAVVDGNGKVLGEALNQQTQTHLKTGGIIPNVAKEMHADNIECVVQEALNKAQMDLMDLDGIAVTTKPGLAMSLRVGLAHAQKIAHITSKQLIPIHHMEAHALTARMIDVVPFPFLVLLTSGGHCLLALARGVEDFQLLGTTQDTAPGEAYDKTARELKLNTMPGLETVCGGAAVEKMAEKGDPASFPPLHIMMGRADCNFSFTGLKISARRQILAEYERQGIPDTELLPNAPDLCAWFQYNVTYHLARRLQRAFIFTELQGLITETKTLVMSGGVASNMFIRSCLQRVCDKYGYNLVCPPQHLCTDNGIMIAWNGIEKVLAGTDCFRDPYGLQVQARAPFGQDISKQVTNTSIRLPKLNIL